MSNELTSLYPFSPRNLCGEIVDISDGLKSGEDDICCTSYAGVGLRDALHFMFSKGLHTDDVPLEDISIGNVRP